MGRGVFAHGVKVSGVVGDGVAVSVCALVVVLALLIMARSCSNRDGFAHLHGLKLSARVVLRASLAPYTHIYNR